MTTYHPIDGGLASVPDDFDPDRPVGEVPAAASDVMARAIERITPRETTASFIPAVHGGSPVEVAALRVAGFYDQNRARQTPDFWSALGTLVRVVKEVG